MSTSTLSSQHTGLSDGRSRTHFAADECTFGSINSNMSCTKLVKPTERILRYGETVDSLFCLTDASDSRHRKLCTEICSGEKSNDAAAWRKALEFSLSSSAGHSQGPSEIGECILSSVSYDHAQSNPIFIVPDIHHSQNRTQCIGS